MTSPRRKHHLFAILALGILALGLGGCDGKAVNGQPGGAGGKKGGAGAPGGAKRPILVVAATAQRKDVPIELRQPTAAVEPVATVVVRARVNGQLEKVHFHEGQEVKKDDLLFTIDPLLLKSVLHQAEANLERDRAQAANALADVQRYEKLMAKDAVAPAEYEKIKTNYEALKAVAEAEQASVDNAKLQLSYAEIRAPIGGITGSLNVDQGNLVKANDTELVTINQLSPIYVLFSTDENQLPVIKQAMAERELTVLATIPNETKPERGTLTFINNTVTPGTGQIQMRATFANEGRRLWPGQFVNVTLELGTEEGATVVPSTAIQTDQDGTFVFVIRPAMTVEQRRVKVGREMEGMSVIAEGLKPGERVVTEGQLQLVADSPVEIKGEGARKGPWKTDGATTGTQAAGRKTGP